jgi:hypothetical protein
MKIDSVTSAEDLIWVIGGVPMTIKGDEFQIISDFREALRVFLRTWDPDLTKISPKDLSNLKTLANILEKRRLR